VRFRYAPDVYTAIYIEKSPPSFVAHSRREKHLQTAMSEFDTKLENWCRRLIEAYVEEDATTTETGITAKGNGKLASRQPPLQIKTESEAAGGDRAKEAEVAGYAGGTEPECAERERVAPSNELLQLIDSVRDPPAARRGGGGRRDARAEPVGEPLVVPQSLPRAMKTNIYRVTRQEFAELYGMEAGLAQVETGSLSRCELIAMYMKSFRNILNYDLLELREHETYFSRFVGYCTHVLHDLVDALFPDNTHMDIVSFHAQKSISLSYIT
jgi:hypothetical protein